MNDYYEYHESKESLLRDYDTATCSECGKECKMVKHDVHSEYCLEDYVFLSDCCEAELE